MLEHALSKGMMREWLVKRRRSDPNGFNVSHFPREVCMRTRKVVKSAEQLQKYVSATNGKDNITTTVYGFRELKPKGNRCEYNTAVVPHFVVDLDKDRLVAEGMDDDEAGQQCSEEAWRLSSHLLTNGWRHAVWFTGGGFHIWVNLDQRVCS